MVTMNSEKSACRRKPADKSGNKKTTENVEEADKKNENNRTNESPDLSPNTLMYNVTASCAEDTPNYLVYKKVSVQITYSIRPFISLNKFNVFLYEIINCFPDGINCGEDVG